MNIIPRFSFHYNRKPFDLADAVVTPTDYGRLYACKDGLNVELHIEEFPAYNAIKWTLWYENKGEYDSGLISDILDCDAASASVYAILTNIPTRMDLDSMSGDRALSDSIV